MGHAHNVYDADPYFVINADTRVITDESETGTSLMQYDHNSERITFEIDRLVDEHDMSVCDRVEVHYINIGTDGKRSIGVYEVDDIILDPEDDQIVKFTWLVSQNATTYSGSLSFVIRFICTTDEEFDYVWNTAIYNEISIGKGMNNGEVVTVQYADVLQSWYNEFIAAGNDGVSRIEKATEDAIVEIEKAKDEMLGGLSKEELAAEVIEAATQATLENLDIEGIANELMPRVNNAVGKASLHGKASGEVIRVDDVNPVEHNVKANVKSKNLIPYPYTDTTKTMNGITFTVNDTGAIIINGTAEGPAAFTIVHYGDGVTVNGKYTLSGINGCTATQCYIQPFTNTGSKATLSDGSVSYSFVDETLVQIRLFVLTGAIMDNVVVYPQLELGDTATEYTPYVDPTTVTVTRCGKNLFDLDTMIGENASLSGDLLVAPYYRSAANIPVVKGNQYTISAYIYSESDNANILAFSVQDGYEVGYTNVAESLGAIVGVTATPTLATITFTALSEYVSISTNVRLMNAIMVELGSIATDYEPYTGTTYTPNPDGTVNGVTSVSPTMTIFTDKSGVTIEAEYNQDINAAFDKVNTLLETLLNGGA